MFQALRRHWFGLKAAVKWVGNSNSLQNTGKLRRIVPREHPSQSEDSGLQVTSFVHPGKPDWIGQETGKERKAEGLKYFSRYSNLRIILQSSDVFFPLIMTHTK